MLLIVLTRRSRRDNNVGRIHEEVARVLRDSSVVGNIRDRNDHDSEKLVKVTFELGEENTICVTQSAPINGQWFDGDNPITGRLRIRVIEAVNRGFIARLTKRAFNFSVDKGESRSVNMLVPFDRNSRPNRGPIKAQTSPSAK